MHAHPLHQTKRLSSTIGRLGLGIIVVFMLGAGLTSAQPVVGQVVNGHISGTVVAEGGAPINTAEITATREVAGDVVQTRNVKTDGAGTFKLEDLSPGTWTLTTRADSFGTNTTAVTVESGKTTEVKIALLPKWSASGTFLSGTVTDAETGSPIKGVLVQVRSWSKSTGQEAGRNATTDAEGKYRIELFLEQNSIQFIRSGYATWYADAWGGGEDQTIDPTLQPVPKQTVTIIGKVVDQAGKGVQAQVQLYVDHSEPQPAGGAEGSDDGSNASSPDAPKPMPIRCCYYDNWNSTITNEDGSFTMKAYPGKVVLRADRRDHLIAEERLTLTEGETKTVTLTLKALPTKTVTLTGKVVDAKTGEPIPNAQVNAQVPLYSDYEWAATDPSGKFTLTLRPGYTLLMVSYYKGYYGEVVMAESYDCPADSPCPATTVAPPPEPAGPEKEYYSRSTVFTTSDGKEKTLDVKLPPKPEPTTTIVGYVIDGATETAIPDAQVSLYNQATGDWGNAVTDKNGSYKFLVRGGYTTMHVWVDGYLPFVIDVDVPSSGSERVDLTMTAGQQGQVGWWDPDGYGYECGYGAPCPVATEAADSPYGMKSAGGAGAPAMPGPTATSDARSMSTGSSTSDGAQVEGGEGGLPPYDPSKSDSTFGLGGDSKESPALPLGVALAVGLVALWTGLRRRE